MHMRNLNDYGVSEFVGFFIVFVISTTAISVIIMWGTPAMENSKSEIALKSAVFQFDALVDVIDEALIEGAFSSNFRTVNSSKEMNFASDAGSVYIDDQAERIVIYYSVNDPFDFNVSGFEIGDPEDRFNFVFTSPSSGSLDLIFNYLNLDTGVERQELPINVLPGVPQVVGPCPFELTDACRVDIIRSSMIPGGNTLYGRIWLFDLGSFNFESTGPSGRYKAVIENGGVLSAYPNGDFYFYNEPKYLLQSLPAGNTMLTLRIIQIKQGSDVDTTSFSSATATGFLIRPGQSGVEESKATLYSNLRMRLYGSESIVNSWRSYYNSTLGFERSKLDDNLLVFPYMVDDTNSLFSLYRASCYVEVGN